MRFFHKSHIQSTGEKCLQIDESQEQVSQHLLMIYKTERVTDYTLMLYFCIWGFIINDIVSQTTPLQRVTDPVLC